MKPIVTAEQMRAIDRATIDDIGIPGFTLMETAGRAVAEAALRMLDGRRGPVAVVCGPGNNGGDGFVVARVLRARDVDATVYLAIARDAVRGDARAHLEVLERVGGVVCMVSTGDQASAQASGIAQSALAIDAMFGTGLTRPIEGHFAVLVAAINAAALRLAVDIPSGLATDTGQTLGVMVTADCTVTMAALKIALVGAPGFASCGDVHVAEIGMPKRAIDAVRPCAALVEDGDVAAMIPRSHALDHKGTRGHVVVIGGMPGMRGAGWLSAIAALRAGAGLCTLANDGGEPRESDAVMTAVIDAGVSKLLDGKRAVVIGPGLGTAAAHAGWVAEVLAAKVPAVIDADALNLVAGDPARLANAVCSVVITPHPGEAARLLGRTVNEIEADRLAAARKLAALTNAVVVLKGARTVVCDGELCWLNPSGSAALATGGTGDVLAGTIGALIAQGAPPLDAARAGAFVHGRAGELLATRHGDRGALSTDLPAAIAGVLADFRA
ncbi:MAG: NAD(P)H-hydrate dehydratase [Kofleriaceae bacterium]